MRDRSSATPLALAMAALVLYASLFPFAGWRWPAGSALGDILRLPWAPWIDRLDELFNLVGYLPLGLLIYVAARRSGGGTKHAAVVAVAVPALLSYATEVVQTFLPNRHPSARDWAMNTLGAGCGAGLGLLLHSMGWIGRWHRIRETWFQRRSAGALALLALWPVGLLFPAPVPWGLGQIGPRLRELLADVLADVRWAEEAYYGLLAAPSNEPLSLVSEVVTSTLGLLAPCLLAYAITVPGRRRVVLAAGAITLGFAAMTLSTLLNFGPQHALAWMTAAARTATLAAMLVALLLAWLPTRWILGIALLALAALAALVSHAPTDPYFAQTLQAWELGRFVHFHGLAQWIGWLWPFGAIAWLLVRLGDRDAGRP